MSGLIAQVEHIEVNGIYTLAPHSGYIVPFWDEETATVGVSVGNGHQVDKGGKGRFPFLDTYMQANCKLTTDKPVQVTLVRLMPVIDL